MEVGKKQEKDKRGILRGVNPDDEEDDVDDESPVSPAEASSMFQFGSDHINN